MHIGSTKAPLARRLRAEGPSARSLSFQRFTVLAGVFFDSTLPPRRGAQSRGLPKAFLKVPPNARPRLPSSRHHRPAERKTHRTTAESHRATHAESAFSRTSPRTERRARTAEPAVATGARNGTYARAFVPGAPGAQGTYPRCGLYYRSSRVFACLEAVHHPNSRSPSMQRCTTRCSPRWRRRASASRRG